MFNPYIILAATIAFLLAVGGAYIKGRGDGGDLVRAEWSNQALREANEHAAKVKELTDRTRATEARWAVQNAKAGKTLQVERANHETTKRAAVDAVHAGTLRLRDAFASGESACRGSGAETAGTGPSDHGGATGDVSKAPAGILSERASEFLIDLASECDGIASQLKAAQDVIRSDRQ